MTKEITINPIGSPTVVTFPNWKVKSVGGAESYVVLVGNISDGFYDGGRCCNGNNIIHDYDVVHD